MNVYRTAFGDITMPAGLTPGGLLDILRSAADALDHSVDLRDLIAEVESIEAAKLAAERGPKTLLDLLLEGGDAAQ